MFINLGPAWFKGGGFSGGKVQSYIFSTIVAVKMTLDKKIFKSKWERNILPSKLGIALG